MIDNLTNKIEDSTLYLKVLKKRGMQSIKSLKILLIILSLFLTLILVSVLVTGLKGTSSDYDVWSKFDFGSTANASSSSYSQRMSGGSQVVGRYTDSGYSGRFGILDQSKNTAINLTSPLNGTDVIRGNDITSNEDDLGLVSNTLDIIAKVYANSTGSGIPNANCSFYFDSTLFGTALSNSSGHCNISYDKSSKSVGNHSIFVNYTLAGYNIVVTNSSLDINIIRYIVPNDAANRGVATQYVWNQTSILYFNITKINETGTFFYDPANITANATDSVNKPYPEAAYVNSYRLYRTATGQYQTHVVINQSLLSGYSAYIRWKVFVSDDNWSSYIASALHTDVGITNAPICGNSLVEAGEACDDGNLINGDGCSSSCATEGGGGGGGREPPCTPNIVCSEWSRCVDGTQTRVCADLNGCVPGSLESRDCESCDENWDCSEWSECFWGALEDYSGTDSGGITGGVIFGIINPVLLEGITKNVEEPAGIEKIKEIEVEINIKRLIIKLIDTLKLTGKTIFDKFPWITGEDVDTSCDSVDDVGSKRCHPTKETKYQECTLEEKKNKILFSWENFACSSGLVCIGDGECSCSDKNSCEVEGERICDGRKVLACQKDSNGCLKWIIAERCSFFSEVCIDGKCVDKHCTDGIQNYDEEGIDCGGSCPEECVIEPLPPTPICGDGVVEGSELCDDANVLSEGCGDGSVQSGIYCNAECSAEIILSEACDDGNLINGDGCSSNCKLEIKSVCGDGLVQGIEICDDGNTENGDGCSDSCNIEEGWVCIGEPSDCTTEKDVVINVTVEDEKHPLEENQYLVNIGESVSIEINQGDDVSVTYEALRGNIILLRVKNVETEDSNKEVKEAHNVRVDKLEEGKIVVTVTSTPITKDVPIGGTVIFDLSLPKQFIQTRDCTDLNNCGTTFDKPETAKLCEEKPKPGEEPCEEDWKCEWSICEEEDEYSYAYNCVDLNACGTSEDKPEQLPCDEVPLNETEKLCDPDWDCNKWSECSAKYNLQDVLSDKTSVYGFKERYCVDLTGCLEDKTDMKRCFLGVPIDARKTRWCEEDYVEIYEKETDKLVSRIKKTEIAKFVELDRVDISFITTEFTGYCWYCYDRIKNYDEAGVDCGGQSCPACVKKIKFFDWLSWLIILLWILLLLLLILLWRREKKEEKKIIKPLKRKLSERILSIFKPISRGKERALERKIEGWFKKIIFAPFRLIALPFKISIKIVRRPRVKIPGVPREAVRVRAPEVIMPPRERIINRLKRRLGELRRRGYYGTARLEAQIEKLRSGIRRRVGQGFRRKAEGGIEKREKRFEKIRYKPIYKPKTKPIIKPLLKNLSKAIIPIIASFKEGMKKRRERIEARRKQRQWQREAKKRQKEVERELRKRERQYKRMIKRAEKIAKKAMPAKIKYPKINLFARLKHKLKEFKIKKPKPITPKPIKLKIRKPIESFITRFVTYYKKKRAERKEKKKLRTIRRGFKKKIKEAKREAKRKIRVEKKARRKAEKKERKAKRASRRREKKEKRKAERALKKRIKVQRKIKRKKIRALKREIRKRKMLNLMRKLKLWRKEGYYGTAQLETQLKKLKEQ